MLRYVSFLLRLSIMLDSNIRHDECMTNHSHSHHLDDSVWSLKRLTAPSHRAWVVQLKWVLIQTIVCRIHETTVWWDVLVWFMQQKMTWYSTYITVITLTDSQIVYGVIDIYCGLDESPQILTINMQDMVTFHGEKSKQYTRTHISLIHH